MGLVRFDERIGPKDFIDFFAYTKRVRNDEEGIRNGSIFYLNYLGPLSWTLTLR